MGLDEVWIIGDLFDRAKPSLGDIIAAKHFVTELGIPIKYLEGNHERINKDLYTLRLLEDVLGIQELPQGFEIEDVGVTAISHRDIHKIKDLPSDDLLLSHFRWSHPVFGEGELNKTTEKFISENYQLALLGDIHYPYEPEDTVNYISSPYSINYGNQKDYGMVVIEFSNGMFDPQRVILDLPSKISLSTNLGVINGVLEGLDPRHLYKIKVNIRLEQFEKFKKIKYPNNVILIPSIEEEIRKETGREKIEISGEIKEVLMDTLSLPKADKDYIREIIKEI